MIMEKFILNGKFSYLNGKLKKMNYSPFIKLILFIVLWRWGKKSRWGPERKKSLIFDIFSYFINNSLPNMILFK